MSIWTSFFLVISAVILAYPFLEANSRSSGDNRSGVGDSPRPPVRGHWNEEEAQLDLDVGRLDPDNFEAGNGQVSSLSADTPGDASESNEEDDGNLPEGSTAQ